MPKFYLYIFDTISEKLSLPKDTSDRKVVLQTQLLDTLTITTSTSKKMSENNETPCLSNEIDHWLRWSVVTTLKLPMKCVCNTHTSCIGITQLSPRQVHDVNLASCMSRRRQAAVLTHLVLPALLLCCYSTATPLLLCCLVAIVLGVSRPSAG